MRDVTRCLECRKPIQQKRIGRPRLYCNDTCKWVVHARQKREYRRIGTVQCPTCGHRRKV